MSVYISLFTAVIPINYNDEFLEIFEATTSLFCCCFKHTWTSSFLVQKIEKPFHKKRNNTVVLSDLFVATFCVNNWSSDKTVLWYCLYLTETWTFDNALLSACDVIGRYQHRLVAQIFRIPERVAPREHSSSDNYDNQVWLTHNKRVTHSHQWYDSLIPRVWFTCSRPGIS